MRTLKSWLVAAAGAAAVAALPCSFAQPAASPAPPPLEKLEDADPPANAARAPAPQRSVAEKRASGGRVTEITVNSGNSKYYLKPNGTSGYVAPEAPGSAARAAQWEILKFDLRRPQPHQPAPAAAMPPPAEK